MLSVDSALFSRINGDATLQGLLGGANRIFHANEEQLPKAPGIFYKTISTLPGSIDGDQVNGQEKIYSLMVFGRISEMEQRLIQLLHGHTFAASSDAGALQVVFDSSGPELFDEDLQSDYKDVRFRVQVVPMAYAPV